MMMMMMITMMTTTTRRRIFGDDNSGRKDGNDMDERRLNVIPVLVFFFRFLCSCSLLSFEEVLGGHVDEHHEYS